MSNEQSERLQVGGAAPDVTVRATDGSALVLSSLWQDGPAVLAFLRHFG